MATNKLRDKYLFIQIILGLAYSVCVAQQGIYHQGGLFLGENAQIGIHTNWINNASLEESLGVVGFYGNQSLEISGTFPPIIYDGELFNISGVDLSTNLYIRNSFSFFDGDLRTSKSDLSNGVFFESLSFSQGSANDSKVDGQVSFFDQVIFRAPIGTATKLRSVEFDFGTVPSRGSCVYYYENPNFPISIPDVFNTLALAPTLDIVSENEFWIIRSGDPASITVSWDQESSLDTYTENNEAITLVGWNSRLNLWTPIPIKERVGSINEGFLITQPFDTNEYLAFTFGILDQPDEILELGNYFLSPNGDGINDRLVIEELEQSPNNRVVIFNRAGLKVFEFDNYTNQFDGSANSGSTFYGIDLGLPEGIYFYIARLDDLNLNFQGFIFLDR